MLSWSTFGPNVIVPEYTSAAGFRSGPTSRPQTLHLISGYLPEASVAIVP